MQAVLPLLPVLLLGACITTSQTAQPQPPVESEVPVTLSPGESAQTDGLELTFLGVDGDNRCPRDVQCIVGGQALVRILAEASGEESSELRLAVPPDAEAKAHYAKYEISVDLEPEATAGEGIDPGDYSVTIRAARKSDEVN